MHQDHHRAAYLNHGEITESGTHEELIAKGGYYAELVKLQTGENDREQV